MKHFSSTIVTSFMATLAILVTADTAVAGGDIVVAAKLKATTTSSTLYGPGATAILPPIAFPEDVIRLSLMVDLQ